MFGSVETQPCSSGQAALADMLRAEYATHERAGGAGAEGSRDSYPAVAAVAASGDLGFCTGPFAAVASDGAPAVGHFLSIWRRDGECNWQSALYTRVSHKAPLYAEPRLSAGSLYAGNLTAQSEVAPPSKFIAADAMDHAIDDFQNVAIEDGFPGALRTFARNGDFGFLTDDELPMTLDGANGYLEQHLFRGEWRQSVRAKSRDSTLLYSVGELADAKHHANHSYVQIWQFDPKVVNWGLRLLVLKTL